MFLPCFLLKRCSQWLMDYDLNAPSAGGEFIVSIIGSNAKPCRCDLVERSQRRFLFPDGGESLLASYSDIKTVGGFMSIL